jgi:hypothetical protein
MRFEDSAAAVRDGSPVSVAERAVRWHAMADRLARLSADEADAERAAGVAADAVTARRLARSLALTHADRVVRAVVVAGDDDADGAGS